MRKVDPTARFARCYNHWLRPDADHFQFGLTDWAQYTIGSIVQLIDLPTVGQQFIPEQQYLSLESDKAITELQAPLGFEVLAINERLLKEPALINEDCYAAGWLFKVFLPDENDWLTLESPEWYESEINNLFRKS